MSRRFLSLLLTMALMLIPASQVNAQGSPASTDLIAEIMFGNVVEDWPEIAEPDPGSPVFVYVPSGLQLETGCVFESGKPLMVGDPNVNPQLFPFFYCPGSGGELLDGTKTTENGLYISIPWLEYAFDGISPSSFQFATAYLMAHMYGHYLQDINGYFDADSKYDVNSKQMELSADCFAGVWASQHYKDSKVFSAEDELTAEAVMATWQEFTDTLTDNDHGTSEDAYKQFLRGFNGRLEDCWPEVIKP